VTFCRGFGQPSAEPPGVTLTMLTHEDYMDVLKQRHEGLTLSRIAGQLGYHPASISRCIGDGGPPPARETATSC
jgi:hypothetical protein